MVIDSFAFTRKAEQLQGQLVLEHSQRLVDQLAEPYGEVSWQVRGYRDEPVGRPAQEWIELQLRGLSFVPCVRCLKAVEHSIAEEFRYLLVANEAQAAELDEQAEDHDVLVASEHFALTELIEDEILMNLPPLAMHERCPQPLPGSTGEENDPDSGQEARPNPFAVLTKLKVL
jgi:uncharacterized protein